MGDRLTRSISLTACNACSTVTNMNKTNEALDTITTRRAQLISARILALVAAGASVRDATDEVLGGGTFEKLAGDVYDRLRAAR